MERLIYKLIFLPPGKGDRARLDLENEAILQINNSGYVNTWYMWNRGEYQV